jgi:hypothetical protein
MTPASCGRSGGRSPQPDTPSLFNPNGSSREICLRGCKLHNSLLTVRIHKPTTEAILLICIACHHEIDELRNPASFAPGVRSLGMMISASRSTIAYSAGVKNCGRFSTGLTCKAALPIPQTNPRLLKPGNRAAAAATPRIRKTCRRPTLVLP